MVERVKDMDGVAESADNGRIDRAASIPTPSASGWTRLRLLSAVGARIALGGALGLWAGDALLLGVTRAGATWKQWMQGIGAAAFVALSTAFVFGCLLGPLVVPPIRSLLSAISERWSALRSGDADIRMRFLARVIAAAGLLVLWCYSTYHVVLAIVYGVARPEAMALGMTAANMALAATLLMAWPWSVRLAQGITTRLAGVRWLHWSFQRTWPIPAAMTFPLVVAATAAIVIQRGQLAYLPWEELGPVAGMILGIGLAARLPRASEHVRRGALALAIMVFGFGFVEAIQLRSTSSAAQYLGFDRAISGHVGYAAWTAALDFDGDGQLNILGGGDCAPFDPTRYTGAPDIPGNGIDEDCDGIDARSEWLKARPPVGIPSTVVPSNPTVIFVTVDALAAPELGSLGGRDTVMPNVDALAKRSMLFTHCFSQGPSTRLSFPSIFTSEWDSQQTFIYSSRLPYSFSPDTRTLQDAFNDAGYETVAILPNDYFDRGRWPSITKGFQRVDSSPIRAPGGHQNAREVTDAALRVLSEQRDRPLYMWLHYYDAHPPYGLPPGASPLPARTEHALYDEELHSIDHEFGRLIDAVNQRSVTILPTYLVFSADHATSWHPVAQSRHGRYGFDVYSSTLHVPLIFNGPGLLTGRVDDVVSTMDIAPTLVNLAHLNDRGKFEGTSLASELVKGINDPKRVIFHEYYLPENTFRGNGDPLEFISARSNEYNLILNRKRGTYELYGWPQDYWEMHDVYESQARLPDVVHLRSLLGAFLQRYAHATQSPTATSSIAHTWTSLFSPKAVAVQR